MLYKRWPIRFKFSTSSQRSEEFHIWTHLHWRFLEKLLLVACLLGSVSIPRWIKLDDGIKSRTGHCCVWEDSDRIQKAKLGEDCEQRMKASAIGPELSSHTSKVLSLPVGTAKVTNSAILPSPPLPVWYWNYPHIDTVVKSQVSLVCLDLCQDLYWVVCDFKRLKNPIGIWGYMGVSLYFSSEFHLSFKLFLDYQRIVSVFVSTFWQTTLGDHYLKQEEGRGRRGGEEAEEAK